MNSNNTTYLHNHSQKTKLEKFYRKLAHTFLRTMFLSVKPSKQNVLENSLWFKTFSSFRTLLRFYDQSISVFWLLYTYCEKALACFTCQLLPNSTCGLASFPLSSPSLSTPTVSLAPPEISYRKGYTINKKRINMRITLNIVASKRKLYKYTKNVFLSKRLGPTLR